MSRRLPLLVLLLAATAAGAAPVATLTPVVLPGGTVGAGFDDLTFSPELGKVLVPSGRTGRLYLLDPATGAMDAVTGFSTEPPPGGRGAGTTSADFGGGFIFAIDRGTRTLNAVDPATRTIVFSITLAGGPDIVRYVAPTREIWVTEPHDRRIEIFGLTVTGGPRLTRAGAIGVPEDAPEALQVDAARHRLYTNQESGTTFAIDLGTRTIVQAWPVGCGPRGLALDETNGLLFVACAEGAVVALDLAHGGKEAGRLTVGEGLDLFAWSPSLRHLYLPCAKTEMVAIVGVSRRGALTLLERLPTGPHAHSSVTDDRGNAWVSDPTRGRLLHVTDRHPASR